MKQNDYLNPKQKEILAQFYSNFALVILTSGVITPLFTGIGNIYLYIVVFITSLSITVFFLKVSLAFLK